MVHLYPVPDEEGLEKTKEFYREKVGREITDGEAYEVLDSVMKFIWLTNGGILARVPVRTKMFSTKVDCRFDPEFGRRLRKEIFELCRLRAGRVR